MEPFLAHRYSLDESKVVLRSKIDVEKNKTFLEAEKTKALKDLKEAKEMVEVEVLTQNKYNIML